MIHLSRLAIGHRPGHGSGGGLDSVSAKDQNRCRSELVFERKPMETVLEGLFHL